MCPRLVKILAFILFIQGVHSALLFYPNSTSSETDFYMVNGYQFSVSAYNAVSYTGTTLLACLTACKGNQYCSVVVMTSTTACTLYPVVVSYVRRSSCNSYIKNRTPAYPRPSLSQLEQLIFANEYYPSGHCPRGFVVSGSSCAFQGGDSVITCCSCYNTRIFPTGTITCPGGNPVAKYLTS